MPKEVQVRARVGKKQLVVVRPILTPSPEGAAAAGMTARPNAVPLPMWGEITTRFEHLGARLTTFPRPGTHDAAGDLWNVWETLTFETGPFPSQTEVRRTNEELRERAAPLADPVRYLYSDRAVEGQGYPLGAVDIVSGYNAVLTLRRVRQVGEAQDAPRPVGTYALQHNAPHAAKLRSPTERLADWDALLPLFEESPDNNAMTRWQEGRERVLAMQYEKFEPFSGRLAQADMTLRAQMTPGLYVPAFTAGDQFHSWDSEATDLYETTRVDRGGVTRTGLAMLATGRRTSTRVTARLVPRKHQILFAWTSVYVVAFIWAPPVFVTEINIGTYSDILPLDWSYVGAEDEVRNDEAMSKRIMRSRRYAVAGLNDHGSEVVSPYFVKLLWRRDDGQWCVREGNRSVGDLAVVLDVDRGGYDPMVPESERRGHRDRYEIRRKTQTTGGRRMNFGRLFISGEVNPYNDPPNSVWSISLPYGSL